MEAPLNQHSSFLQRGILLTKYIFIKVDASTRPIRTNLPSIYTIAPPHNQDLRRELLARVDLEMKNEKLY